MQINGVPNKFEIYQDFYYVTNGEKISYAEALRLFAQMDADEKADFEQYYKDETGYEIITESGYNLNNILGDELSKHTAHYINMKYTLDAYAKSNGLIVDSEWAQFSAEEIIQMENNGVNIPQDVIDIAHTIYESTGVNMAQTDAEDGDAEATTEKEPFLNLIPKAEKKIKKCEENSEKINEKIEDLLPEKQKQERSLNDKVEDQKKALDEYENFVREWRHIQNKVNNGEELTDTEARRYAELTGMLNENKSQDSGFQIDKREIAKSLNELNILAVLGEKLADETIEIGDTLADYTCKSNYKTTKKQVSGQVGFLRAVIAMAQGKNLAKEASKIGNETKDYTDDTHTSVMNIAQIMEVEDSIANTNGASTQEDAQVAEEQQEVQETAETEQSTETSPENGEETTEDTATAQTNDTKEEDFIISDESVSKLIEEAEITNEDLRKQIAFAVESTDTAKSDAAFAKLANEKISKLVKEFNKEEEIRQAEIKKREEENVNEQNEIKKLTAEPQETDNAADDNINKNTIQQHKETIAQNNKEIEGIKAESVQAKETFKSQTASEKETLNKSIPVEDEAFNANSEYKNSQIPAYTAQLDFTNASGITLAKMGAYLFEMGLREAFGLIISRRALWLMEAGQRSMAIGAQAQREATLPYLEKATKSTTEAETLTGEVLNDMTILDGQITAITGDDNASTPASDAKASEQQQEENQQTSQAPAMENAETTATVETTTKAQTPAMSAAQPEITGAAAPIEAEQQTTVAPQAEENSVKKEAENKKADEVQEETINIAQDKPQEALENIQQTNETENLVPKSNSANKKEEEELTTDKAQENVDNINASAADDSKDSEKVLKDTEKDEKQLEKETKKLQKQMQKDQKEIVRMTKQSERAAKKQEEALVEFEELTTQSEQLIAEDENKQKQAPQPAQNNDEQQGVLATSSFTAGGSDNSQQLQTNDERINVLSSEFKLNGNVIKRNSVKIKKLEKSTKANQTKFNKKTKIRTKKIKEAEKKEQEKQKRLAKQLAAVGIAENVFSITLSCGTIMVEYIAPPLLSNPFTAATGAAIMTAGSYMIVVGTYGVAACGVTKAAINIANGNWTAALIGLGTTAVSIAGSFVPGVGAAAGSVLNAVSTGLSVVSSSAQLVNNVRAVQGKEASGVFSKIGTVAGVASSLTSAASGLQNMQGTFGTATAIASAAGSALSATSQLMTEFGAGGKTADILGMIGGGLQTAASVAQLAQKFSGASEKNEENKEKTEEKKNDEKSESKDKTEQKSDDKNPDGTEKTKEQKKAEAKQKKEEAKQAKEQKKAEEKQRKQAEKEQKQAEKQAKKEELKEAKQAKNDKKEEAKDVKDKKQKENMTKNGSSAYYSDKTDADLQAELASIEKTTPPGATSMGADKIRQELQNREKYRGQMAALDANSQQKRETVNQVISAVGNASQVVMGVVNSGKQQQENGQNKRHARQWTAEEMKRVNKYKKLRQLQQNHAMNYKRA